MKKKNLIITLICIVLIIVGIATGIGVRINNKEKPSRELNNGLLNRTKNYKINIEKIGVTTLNEDDIFYSNLNDNYKGYKLILVSFDLKNNTGTNYENLDYKLVTSNDNEYNVATSYVTNDIEYLENYYKINKKIFNDSTENLLGAKTKRGIIGFMIPENEINNDTNFTLIVRSFNLDENEVEKLKFNSSELAKSYTMKELYKLDEIEKAEQTISLAYLSCQNDWMTWLGKMEIAYNYKDNKSFLITFNAIKVFAESAKWNYLWNGMNKKIDGFKLDFKKVKKFYPEISDKIELAKKGTEEMNKLSQTYNNTINSLNKDLMKKMDKDILSFTEISNFFDLRY